MSHLLQYAFKINQQMCVVSLALSAPEGVPSVVVRNLRPRSGCVGPLFSSFLSVLSFCILCFCVGNLVLVIALVCCSERLQMRHRHMPQANLAWTFARAAVTRGGNPTPRVVHQTLQSHPWTHDEKRTSRTNCQEMCRDSWRRASRLTGLARDQARRLCGRYRSVCFLRWERSLEQNVANVKGAAWFFTMHVARGSDQRSDHVAQENTFRLCFLLGTFPVRSEVCSLVADQGCRGRRKLFR